MIYLIGGAPRVGKSIIAKQFAESINGRLVSTDELENPGQEPSVIFYGDPKKNILTPGERVKAITNEAKQIISDINDILDGAANELQNTVIEGVHLFPAHIADCIKKIGKDNIKAIFIGSTNIELILQSMARNTSPNNWPGDFNQDVLMQIALFTKAFSDYLYNESKKYNLLYKERSSYFQEDTRDIIKELSK